MRSSIEDQLADFDALVAQGPDYTSSAVFGAFVGAAVGFWAIKRREPAERHVLKYAAIGAVINMGISYGMVALGKKASEYAHQHPEIFVPPPHSPVVTKGAFAGAPRALYHARHPFMPQGQGQDQGQDQGQYQDPNQFQQQQDGRGHHHHHHGGRGHHVGGPIPPGGDYSFTRRPGFNSKEY